jgi:hypothetical protein
MNRRYMEVIVLGLISALRPASSQVAVLALLRAPAAPRTLLVFTAAGFVFSVLVGLLGVSVLDDADRVFRHSTFHAAFNLAAGVAALGFAAGVQRGALDRRRGRERSNGRRTSAIAARLRHPSAKMAAGAGVVTHVPGLIYLVVLNSIASSNPGLVEASAQVALYNLLWFAIPLGALVLVLRSPATATAFLDRMTAWARRHEDPLVVAVFGALGIYLCANGLLALT